MILKNIIKTRNLSLGAAQFGQIKYSHYFKGIISPGELKKIINYSYKMNIRHIDTSLNYEGVSEKLSKTNLSFRNFKITTKVRQPKIDEKNYSKKILKLLEEDLKKLKLKNYYAILLHNCKNLSKIQIEEIEKLKNLTIKKNLTKNFGFSIYDKKEYFRISKYFLPHIVQLPFSIVDSDLNKINFIRYLKKKKIKVQARSVFLKGILLNNVPKKKFFKDNRLQTFKKKFNFFCKKKNISEISACINYVLNKNYFESVVFGVLSLRELISILNIKKQKNININFGIPKKYKRIDLWK